MDAIEAQPHDPDVKALLRIAAVWNIPIACNRASANFLVTSPLMAKPYLWQVPDAGVHLERSIELGPAATMAPNHSLPPRP